MKTSAIGREELEAASPIFKGKIGALLGRLFLKLTKIDRVNLLYKRCCHKRGHAFTTLALEDMEVSYELVGGENLDNLPHGSFITVSNHPLGGIDGVMLIDIIAKRRSDYKVMVNGVLTNLEAMSDNFIAVKPSTSSTSKSVDAANIAGIRESLAHVRAGHPMGFFPAGAISMLDCKTGVIEDRDWQQSVVRLIQKAAVPIYPIYFDGLNSNFFYQLGRIDWRIRTLRVAWEVFNKKGEVMKVVIGKPITAKEQAKYKSVDSLAAFLKEKTYQLKPTK
ncbi:MAG: lysophospholipid acyltransferase family protein [Bacteroidales bacterium]